MKLMFMGTPDFSLECLKSLIEAGHHICSVVTTPDKPRGRGHKLCSTPVGQYAENSGINVYKPNNLKMENFKDILYAECPDVIVVVAYGKILPKYVLDFPKYGCINVHASLLPQYRGAAPIQRVIIDGMTKTGVTTMYMAEGLDTGDMLMKSEVEISLDDNFETLHDKLALSGADLIVRTLAEIENASIKRVKQDDSKSNYAHMITKETALIDWSKSSLEVHNLVRGLFPVPKAYTFYNGRQMKICKTEYLDKSSDLLPGTIDSIDSDSLYVVCGDGKLLKIINLQIEGKRMMSVKDYLIGNSIENNIRLGE